MKKRIFTFAIVCMALMFLLACPVAENPEQETDPETVSSVSVEPETLTLMVGRSSQLSVEVLPANAANKNVTWVADNELVATVSETGLVAATGEGTAILTVTTEDGGFQDTCSVTVFEPVPFVSVWDLTLTGTKTLSIPLALYGVYDFEIDWGDGTVEEYTSRGVSHTYANVDTYTVTITGICEGFGFSAALEDNGDNLVDISQWGSVKIHNNGQVFRDCDNLTGFSATDEPDLTGITNFSGMFEDAANFNGDISGWDVSDATDMSYMFCFANVFNQDIGGWDVSNVSDMRSMFYFAYDYNQDMGEWNVSNVTDMSHMFSNDLDFNRDIGSWNVSGVSNMSSMFNNARVFNRYIGAWDVSNVTDMSDMFSSAQEFNQNIGFWDVSGVTNMSGMFSWAYAFDQDINTWDVSGVTDMSNMFFSANSFNHDISGWDVSEVNNMSKMFRNINSFNRDIGDWDVSGVENMYCMFNNAASFDNNGDPAGLEDWAEHLAAGVNMVSMFSGSAMEGSEPSWYVP
ncbi:MAG: BspA family leucine-rich repeat surface protein [Spirochaetales bacterium]|nr:BspA family leucine-rich repeat surface protein [Spirochaetales bacterium]